MNDSRRDFLELVTQIRSHLEYHAALGVRYIETLAPGTFQTPTQLEFGASARTAAGRAVQERAPETQTGLAAVQREMTDCTRCKLHKARKSIVFGEGNPKAALVFVGEGPGQEEDAQGRPFVGSAGQLLTDIIVKGMKLRREDVYICNVVKCRPPDNRNPEPDEIASCEPFLARQLRAVGPRVIVALGNVAVKTLLKTGEGITGLRGSWQNYKGIPLMPTFHPAYLLRNPKDKKLVWEDIQQVMTKLGLTVTR